MVKSKVVDLLEKKYGYNHIIANSIAKSFGTEIKIGKGLEIKIDNLIK